MQLQYFSVLLLINIAAFVISSSWFSVIVTLFFTLAEFMITTEEFDVVLSIIISGADPEYFKKGGH